MLAQLILSHQIKKIREVYLPIENEKSSEVPQHEGATTRVLSLRNQKKWRYPFWSIFLDLEKSFYSLSASSSINITFFFLSQASKHSTSSQQLVKFVPPSQSGDEATPLMFEELNSLQEQSPNQMIMRGAGWPRGEEARAHNHATRGWWGGGNDSEGGRWSPKRQRPQGRSSSPRHKRSRE